MSDANLKFGFARHLLDLALHDGHIPVRASESLPVATQHLVNDEVRDITNQEQAHATAQRGEIERNVTGRLLAQIESEGFYNVPGATPSDVENEPIVRPRYPKMEQPSRHVVKPPIADDTRGQWHIVSGDRSHGPPSDLVKRISRILSKG